MSDALTMMPAPAVGPAAELAAKHMPILMLDAGEPYAPKVMGFTVFDAAGASSSSAFDIVPQGAFCIEYAIWYDWDIQHLYDLEHVWVHVDDGGDVLAVEASFHGKRVPMDLVGAVPKLHGARPVLYVEPGKHAHWADGYAMAQIAGDAIRTACGHQAGSEGVHTGNPFYETGAYGFSLLQNRLATRKMQRDAFVPRFEFSRSSDDMPVTLCSWTDLQAWIPSRVRALMDILPVTVPHLKALFLDCGDTLVDEATEVKIEGTEIVTSADEIPHAMEAVRTLDALGYPMVLVADGPPETFQNLLKPRGIWDLMQGHVISGNIGELKPSPKMFAAAMEVLGLSEADKSQVVMVGNNLSRDIKGANEFGLQSLFVGWSTRRTHAAKEPAEVPTARINRLDHLVDTIAAMELALPAETSNG